MPDCCRRALILLVFPVIISGCEKGQGDLVEPSMEPISSTTFLVTTVEDPPQFILKWGSEGAEDGQFYQPWGLVADADERVYVADTRRNRIQKFTNDGAFLTKWGAGIVWGVAVDAAGNVYAANIFNRIQKFDSNGNLLTEWGSAGSGDGQLFSPHDVAVDKSGNVYVADTGNHRIQKFTSEGAYITKWGTPGNGSSQITNPFGVDVDADGNVYVIETGNNRVHKFTSDGIHITMWGSFGTGMGRFRNPTGIGVDSSGNVYVADTDNHRIQKFTSSGAFLTQWGSLGSGDGRFDRPGDVSVDRRGNVYVADTFNHRIQKFGSAAQSVDLDVKPKSCPNPLNPGSRGVLPVAILGTADFDVHDIELSSVLLEGVLAPLRNSIEDVGAGDGQGCDCTTDGPDGLDDLTLKFRTQDLVSCLGSLSPGDTREITITGQLLDGTSFEGVDCVVIVGKPSDPYLKENSVRR